MASKITLLVLAAQLLLAAAAPTATTTATPAAIPDRPAVPAAPLPPLPFPANEGVAGAECWKAVVQATETCAGDILRRLASPSPAVRVGPACCGVLNRVGEKCLRDLFPGSPFGRFYAPFVAHACGGIPIGVASATPGGRQ